MSDNFSEGLSSAYTSSESIPTSWAMTSATARRSPVAIRGLIPRAFISAIASALEIFARSATKIVPTSVPSTTTSTPVSALLDGSAEVHTSTMTLPTAPRTPKPGILTASTATGSSPSISCRAASKIARAIGCWCDASTAPAWRSTSSRDQPPTPVTEVTHICPVVIVPVLSRTNVSTVRVCSRMRGPLIKMPA